MENKSSAYKVIRLMEWGERPTDWLMAPNISCLSSALWRFVCCEMQDVFCILPALQSVMQCQDLGEHREATPMSGWLAAVLYVELM